MIKNVLSIAGVDPSGGAGVLADIKTMSALGVYGCGVVTALTAQNTQGVVDIYPVAPPFIEREIDAIFSDIRIDAIKIGMLSDVDVIEVVVRAIKRYRPKNIVLDPVMISKSGHHLLAADAVDSLKRDLLPLVDFVTPNLPEAMALLGGNRQTITENNMEEAAQSIQAMMKKNAWIYLKGGHLTDSSTSMDYLFNGLVPVWLNAQRITTKNTHGTGCTLSSALAAMLTQTEDKIEAARLAKAYLTGAISHADELSVGKGFGPVHHFWNTWIDKKE